MKSLILVIVAFTSLIANESSHLIVKDADILVKISGAKKILPKDTQINLIGGDSICFINGDGRIIINDYKQLTKEDKSCYIVPISKNVDMKEFIASLKDKVYVAYFDSTETLRHGSSAKGSNPQKSSDIILKKGQDLLISSNRFGPLPVEISIYDENDVLLDTFTNEKELNTLLRISRDALKDGYKLKVLNGFHQELMKIKILLQDR